VVCAECQTAYRDENSKFCKGCGRRLSVAVPAVVAAALDVAEPADTLPGIEEEWPATQRMAYHPDMAPDEFFNRAIPATAIAGAAEAVSRARRTLLPPIPASPSSSSLARNARRSASRRSSRSRNIAGERQSIASRLGTWSVVIAVVAMVAVGWGYVYNSRNSAVPPVAKEVSVPVPAEPATPPPVAQVAEPAPAPVIREVPTVEDPPAAPANPVAAAVKPRKAAAPVAVVPQPSATPVSEPAPPPPSEPVAPASPQSLCAGLNFFARAQCMASQCAKADFRSHAQCEAVRRQQQIEEEKRNPTLIN
jgi:hypothetical protein